MLRPLGLIVANDDGKYNRRNEVLLQTILAALLMAALATTIYFTARLVLPVVWSVVVAMGAAVVPPTRLSGELTIVIAR